MGATLRELAGLFLKLGTIGFGGPAAHIALMQDEVVEKRGWMDRQRFLDLVGATNLIPGPTSTELAIHIGREQAGWRGLTVAGTCFIVPAMLIVLGFAWAYVEFGETVQAEAILYGIQPVMIAIVLQALVKLLPAALKTVGLWIVGVLVLVAYLFGVNELILLVGSGVLLMVVRGLGPNPGLCGFAPLAVAPIVGLDHLFLVFLKIGAVLYGSGYVLLAFLRTDLVETLGWLTEKQLIDAVAVGQVTPGPLFTTATFIGYVLAGLPGALLATLGIFLPSFIFVALTHPLIERVRRSPRLSALLDGINAAALALMAGVTFQLGLVAIRDWLTALIAIISAGLLFKTEVNNVILVIAGALAGLLHLVL